MSSRRQMLLVVVSLSVVGAVACGLNPQPLPPDNGTGNAGTPSGDNSTNGGGAPAGDAAGTGDAGSDDGEASSDGCDEDATDATSSDVDAGDSD
ncbi:MAG: hypothetical protein FWD69_15435 [Polyangiaceae bacterium]|nr:hypothetical protein [Polyangiaceae bacterium]